MRNKLLILMAMSSMAATFSGCSTIKIKDLKFHSVEVADPATAARETKSQRAGETLLKISFVTRELTPAKPTYHVMVGSCDSNSGERSMMGPVGASETPGYYPNADGEAYHFYIVSAFDVNKRGHGNIVSHDMNSAPKDVCFKLKHRDYIPSYSNLERVPADQISKALEKAAH